MLKQSLLAKTVLLAALVLLGTAQRSQAQGGGRGFGGGVGAGHPGIAGPGYGYGRGFGYGYGRGGWGYGGGFYGDIWIGGPYGYGYGPYPYYDAYPYPYAYPMPVPYYQPAPIVAGPGSGNQPSSAPVPTNNSATVQIRVPPGAEVWFDSHKTSQQGTDLLFSTPPLTPGLSFTYEIRATWMANGEPTTQTRVVQVQAGQRSIVDFLAPIAAPSR